MKLHELIECANCEEVDAPTRHGTCRSCGSYAIAWLVRQQLWPEDFAGPEPAPIHLCGIDREFLREIGVQA